MTKENHVPGTFLTSSPPPTGRSSVDAGKLDLGVKSTQTHDDQIIAGAERSHSLRAEALTSDQLSSDSWLGTLGAPSKTSTPLLLVDMNVNSLLRDEGEGSATMSISPLLDSVDGLQTSHIQPHIPRNVNFNSNIENMSWYDFPDDGDLGEVLEFSVLTPNVPSVTSTPIIFRELKGKMVDPSKKPHTNEKNKLADWLDYWNKTDETTAILSRPGPGGSEDSLQGLWDDNK
ncbi:hypothetical protein BD769DRAFT_1668416 [Suillus cothurnatus]|jgi:hypothetical protein|nr:hypothetical protein BD769DRAFT_1668416 [Suillus cothurnatus]